ncbi:MAG: hypothetical protein FWF49_02755 [Oscillospiraceae bacterium]|nr:hypothetical protein [Oscillospiraceae bacterium]
MNRHGRAPRRITAMLATVLLTAVPLAGCSPAAVDSSSPETTAISRPEITVASYQEGDMLTLALQAQADMYANFWDAGANIVTKTDNYGLPISSDQQETALWHQSMMVWEMYSLYLATGDQTLKDRITAQWEFTKGNFTQGQLISHFSQAPNIAVDDTGWNAMVFITYYKVTGDIYALQLAKALIQNGYSYYRDGDTVNGLWYPQNPPSAPSGASGKIDNRWKSVYAVGIVSAALEFQMITGDDSLFADSLNIYNWMEQNLLRNGDYSVTKQDGSVVTMNCTDNLYWCDFNVGRTKATEVDGPSGGLRPADIHEAGSVSGLFGNMGMGVIQARLYKLTGDTRYLDAALRTVKALNESSYYDNNGVYVNDRDAWTNATFMGPWVSEVLTLPGIQTRDYERVIQTAQSIGQNCRTADGYWRAEWSGGNRWEALMSPSFYFSYKQLTTSADTVGMLTAAALLEKQLYA